MSSLKCPTANINSTSSVMISFCLIYAEFYWKLGDLTLIFLNKYVFISHNQSLGVSEYFWMNTLTI